MFGDQNSDWGPGVAEMQAMRSIFIRFGFLWVGMYYDLSYMFKYVRTYKYILDWMSG